MQRERGPQHRAPSLGVRGLAGSVPPTPLGFGGPALCEFSLTPQTRSESDPSKTRFSTRAGSSAGTGSNQRQGAFSPRRRDPRCKKTQPHRPHRFSCSLPGTTVFPPDLRGPVLLIGSGGPHQFLRPQLLFSPLFLPDPLVSTFAGHNNSGRYSGRGDGQERPRPDCRGLRRAEVSHARWHGLDEVSLPDSHPAAYPSQRRSNALGAVVCAARSRSLRLLSHRRPLCFL